MTQTPKQLPDSVLQYVGQVVAWQENRPVVVEGEAHLLPAEDSGLVLGARWARTADGKAIGEAYGMVQFLMERPDQTTRWTTPLVAIEEATAMPSVAEQALAVARAETGLTAPQPVDTAALVEFLQGRRRDALRALKASVEAGSDYWRWQGHAELSRQCLEMLGAEVPQP